jgi:hypothetical protein
MKRYGAIAPYTPEALELLKFAEVKAATLWLAGQLRGKYNMISSSLKRRLVSIGLKFDLRKKSEWVRLYTKLYNQIIKLVEYKIGDDLLSTSYDVKRLSDATLAHRNSGHVKIRVELKTARKTVVAIKTCVYTTYFERGKVKLLWKVPQNGDPFAMANYHTSYDLTTALTMCYQTDYDFRQHQKLSQAVVA